jgi:hypothetical protein
VLGAPLLIAAWLAEALRWYQQGQGTVLDGAGGLGVGVNLGDAVWCSWRSRAHRQPSIES